MAILSCFFANLVTFCWKMGILSNMSWQLWKSYSPSSLEFIVLLLPAIFVGVLCLLIIWASSLKSVFSLMCSHWRLCPASVLVSWSADDWTELPLNTVDASGSQPLLRGSTRCWGFLSVLGPVQLCLSLLLLLVPSLKFQRWEFYVYVFPMGGEDVFMFFPGRFIISHWCLFLQIHSNRAELLSFSRSHF